MPRHADAIAVGTGCSGTGGRPHWGHVKHHTCTQRTWGLLGFGLALAAGLGQASINALFMSTPDMSSAWFQAMVGSLSLALQLLTLLGWGFVIVAVLDDRRTAPAREEEEADTAAAQPSADDVDVDDPLGYDPADFEPPRLTS